jgi:hypothetical protein
VDRDEATSLSIMGELRNDSSMHWTSEDCWLCCVPSILINNDFQMYKSTTPQSCGCKQASGPRFPPSPSLLQGSRGKRLVSVQNHIGPFQRDAYIMTSTGTTVTIQANERGPVILTYGLMLSYHCSVPIHLGVKREDVKIEP